MASKNFSLGVTFKGKDGVSPVLKTIRRNTINTSSKMNVLALRMDKAFGGGSLMGRGFGTKGIVLAAAATYGIARGIRSIVDETGRMELATARFGVLLQSTELAKDMIVQLKKAAIETPYDFPDVQGFAETLTTMGVSAGNLIPTIKMLGDVTLGNAEKTKLAAYAYGLLKQNQIATMRELKMFTTAGVPLMGALEKATGKTGRAFKSLISSGGISFSLVQKTLKSMNAEGGQFFNGMITQMNTIPGALANMNDAIGFFKIAIGDTFREQLKSTIWAFTGLTDKVRIYIEANQDLIGGNLSKFFNLLTGSILWARDNFDDFIKTVKKIVGVIKMVLTFIVVLGVLSKAIALISGAMLVFSAITMAGLWPIYLIAIGIAAVLAVVIFALQKMGAIPSFNPFKGIEMPKGFDLDSVMKLGVEHNTKLESGAKKKAGAVKDEGREDWISELLEQATLNASREPISNDAKAATHGGSYATEVTINAPKGAVTEGRRVPGVRLNELNPGELHG